MNTCLQKVYFKEWIKRTIKIKTVSNVHEEGEYVALIGEKWIHLIWTAKNILFVFDGKIFIKMKKTLARINQVNNLYIIIH